MPDFDADKEEMARHVENSMGTPNRDFQDAMQKLGRRLQKGLAENGPKATTVDPYGKAHDDPFDALVREVSEGLMGELPIPDEQSIHSHSIVWNWYINHRITVRAILSTTSNGAKDIKKDDYSVDIIWRPTDIPIFLEFTNYVTPDMSLNDLLLLSKTLMSAWAWRANWKKHVGDLLVKAQEKKIGEFGGVEVIATGGKNSIVVAETNEESPEPYVRKVKDIPQA